MLPYTGCSLIQGAPYTGCYAILTGCFANAILPGCYAIAIAIQGEAPRARKVEGQAAGLRRNKAFTCEVSISVL